jgi:hypothetical protein
LGRSPRTKPNRRVVAADLRGRRFPDAELVPRAPAAFLPFPAIFPARFALRNRDNHE